MQSGRVRDLELELVRMDGTILSVLVSATAVRDSAGKFLMSRTVLYDISERKRTQQEIARTKELLERMFESIHVLVAYMDRDFNFIRVNRAYATADGRTPEFFPGKNHFALYPNAENEALYRRVVQTGEPYVALEKAFQYVEHPERGVSYWDWRVEPVSGSTNEVEGIVLSLLDVTQRVHARLALEKSEEKFRVLSRRHQLILDSAGAGIYGVDLEGRCTFINPAAGKMLGYEPEELIGQPAHEMFHHTRSDGSPYPATQCPVQRTREDGTSSRGSDEVYWRKDGSRFPVEYVSVPIVEDGRVVGAVASFLDISERKRLEQEKEQYLDFFKLSVNPMCIADPFGCFRKVNPAFVKLTGYAESELLTKPFLDFVLPEDREKTAREMELQINVRQSMHFENRYVCKDGAVILLSWTAYFDRNAGATYATAQDITRSREAELAVTRLNRALRTLSACNEMLIHATSESAILESICRLIVDSGGYRMAWVGYAEHDAGQTVRPVAWAGHEEGYLTIAKFLWDDTELGRGPTGTAIRTAKTQLNQSFLTNPALAPWREAALARGYETITALPLKGGAGTFGALSIHASKHQDVSDAEVKLLEELADDLAFGIETLRMRAERDRIAYEHSHHAEILHQSLLDTIKAIADTIGMRDPYTAGHQRRVSQLAVAIASELGMPEESTRVIGLAASIHDVGKIKVPAEILSKPARLHETEMMLVREHAQAGYDILKGIKFPWPIATIVGQHHERLDGSGYPRGLKDGEILLESQILAVADVVEAMASHRPYRPSLGIETTLREIELGRGTLYSPVVAQACLKLFREKAFAFKE
jgi:PAS domain S-box-containing protein/putative nucleotidyltransferase with HDIG domain